MDIKIHVFDEYTESRGKTTKVWGVPSFKEIMLKNGTLGIQIDLSCTEERGTGERKAFNDSQSMITRNATINFDKDDVVRLIGSLIDWEGFCLDEYDALKIIKRLSTDIVNMRDNRSSESDNCGDK